MNKELLFSKLGNILKYAEILMRELEEERDEALADLKFEGEEELLIQYYKKVLTSIYRMRNNTAALLLRNNCTCVDSDENLGILVSGVVCSIPKQALKNILQKEYESILKVNISKTLKDVFSVSVSSKTKNEELVEEVKPDSITLIIADPKIEPPSLDIIPEEEPVQIKTADNLRLNTTDKKNENEEIRILESKAIKETFKTRESVDSKENKKVVDTSKKEESDLFDASFFDQSFFDDDIQISFADEIQDTPTMQDNVLEPIPEPVLVVSVKADPILPSNLTTKDEIPAQKLFVEKIQTDELYEEFDFFNPEQANDKKRSESQIEKNIESIVDNNNNEYASLDTVDDNRDIDFDISFFDNIEPAKNNLNPPLIIKAEEQEPSDSFHTESTEKICLTENESKFQIKSLEERAEVKSNEVNLTAQVKQVADTGFFKPNVVSFDIRDTESKKEQKDNTKPKFITETSSDDPDDIIAHLKKNRELYDMQKLKERVEDLQELPESSETIFDLSTGSSKSGSIDMKDAVNKVERVVDSLMQTSRKDKLFDAAISEYKMQTESDYERNINKFILDIYSIDITILDDNSNSLRQENARLIVAPIAIPETGNKFVTDICAYLESGEESSGEVVAPGGKTTIAIRCEDYSVFIRGAWDNGVFVSTISLVGNGSNISCEIHKKEIRPEELADVGIGHNVLLLDHATTIHIIPVSFENTVRSCTRFMSVVVKDYGIDQDAECIISGSEVDVLIKGEKLKYNIRCAWDDDKNLAVYQRIVK